MDYDIIYTPHLARVDLWKTSGHWDFYQENLFSPMDLDGQEYIVRPMNCPFHIEIYKSRLRSYRDLPIGTRNSALSTGTNAPVFFTAF